MSSRHNKKIIHNNSKLNEEVYNKTNVRPMINTGGSTQFTNSEKSMGQNAPESFSMECNSRRGKDIDNAVMILSDDDDNVYQEPDPVATPSNILHSGTLTVISLMERAITKLRTLTGRNT